jgi:hypothetical protein
MSIASTSVAFFRNQWASRFVDTCVVTRYDFGNPSFSEATGQTAYPTSTPYSGVCLARPAAAREIDFGEDRRQQVAYDLFLPYDAAELKESDEVVVTSTLDPNIPTLTVLRTFGDSYLTKRHYETKAVVDD